MARSSEIVVFSNDVVPGMGLPVAAPGLRAWGLALGLRRHGRPVTLAVHERVVRRAWTRSIPPPAPPGTFVAGPREVGELIRTRRAKAAVLTNSNHFAALGDVGDTALIYDFFAPKILEREQQAPPDRRDVELDQLRKQKLAALRRSSAVVINGAKKVPYVMDWVARAGHEPATIPTAVVNMPVPVQKSSPSSEGPIHAVVSGYLQPWSRPGPWAEVVMPYLDDGSLILHLLVSRHWGGGRQDEASPETFNTLARHPAVRRHGAMEFGDFRRFMAGCHLSVDLFERNPERELAMVTRTAVSLASGVPVIHVPFTETSEFIRTHDAGWLVESDDLAGIKQAFQQAISARDVLAGKRAGAEQVGINLLDPVMATRPLHELLEDMP